MRRINPAAFLKRSNYCLLAGFVIACAFSQAQESDKHLDINTIRFVDAHVLFGCASYGENAYAFFYDITSQNSVASWPLERIALPIILAGSNKNCIAIGSGTRIVVFRPGEAAEKQVKAYSLPFNGPAAVSDNGKFLLGEHTYTKRTLLAWPPLSLQPKSSLICWSTETKEVSDTMDTDIRWVINPTKYILTNSGILYFFEMDGDDNYDCENGVPHNLVMCQTHPFRILAKTRILTSHGTLVQSNDEVYLIVCMNGRVTVNRLGVPSNKEIQMEEMFNYVLPGGGTNAYRYANNHLYYKDEEAGRIADVDLITRQEQVFTCTSPCSFDVSACGEIVVWDGSNKICVSSPKTMRELNPYRIDFLENSDRLAINPCN